MDDYRIDDATICAVSTAAGKGAIAIIRVSGHDAIAIADSVFHGRISLLKAPLRYMQYGVIEDEQGIIDYGMATVFESPHSYTGEDMVEIYCHGSINIQNTIMQTLISKGARYANPGEFSKRAFLNGKMDLTQAEAVADLINAETHASRNLALSQLKGSVKSDIDAIREKLLSIASLLELELDFAEEEDVRFVDKEKTISLIDEIVSIFQALLDSFSYGNAAKEGIKVVIVGEPNAGKSTLLNLLLQDQRAIVSEIPGTTRDTIEETILIGGQKFRIVDTAGIRDSNDPIEKIGIERAMQSVQNAQIILYISDITTHKENDILTRLLNQPDKPILHIWNKIDLIENFLPPTHQNDTIYISLLDGDVGLIRKWFIDYVANLKAAISGSTIITNARHYDAISRALAAIKKVKEGIMGGISNEFVTPDLHDCIDAMGEISGEIRSEDVLQKIFSNFCIGK